MGKTPHSNGHIYGRILWDMKIKRKSELTFGSLMTTAYPAWLARRAGKPVRNDAKARPVTLRAFDIFHEKLARINRINVLVGQIKIGLAIAMLTALTGCIGFVGGGGDYGGGGWWWDDGGWWGGGGRGFDRGHDVRGYSARGAASRGAAHGGGGGHASGGGGHGGGGKR
jgi:hypothetical protein